MFLQISGWWKGEKRVASLSTTLIHLWYKETKSASWWVKTLKKLPLQAYSFETEKSFLKIDCPIILYRNRFDK